MDILSSQPVEVLAVVVRWLTSPHAIASLDCTSRLFHLGAPRSVVEKGLRLRAEAEGREIEAAMPAGETSRTQWLLWEERRLLACEPPLASCGRDHCAFVAADGKLYTCGGDSLSYGYLGQGFRIRNAPSPQAVKLRVMGGVCMRTVSAGQTHTLACDSEGVVFAFGHGRGNAALMNADTPMEVAGLHGVYVTAVAAGRHHSLALSKEGGVYSFGTWHGDSKMLGHGPGPHAAPPQIPQLIGALGQMRVVVVAAGRRHSLALSEAGEVYSFGYNTWGQLGHGDQEDQFTPRLVDALDGVCVCAIDAGWAHSLVASTAGLLFSFGRGIGGRLGHANNATQRSPRLVHSLVYVRVSAIAAGSTHSLALSEGNVYSFGSGQRGELGHGDTADQLVPRMIANLQGVRVRSVSAGNCISLAGTTDGSVYGWGMTPPLGLEPSADQLSPLRYPHLRLHV